MTGMLFLTKLIIMDVFLVLDLCNLNLLKFAHFYFLSLFLTDM